MISLNHVILLVIFMFFSACPRQDIKPDERKESIVSTTLTGTNTLTGNNTTVGTNTSLGVNTTLGTNTLTGNNTVIGVTTTPGEVVETPVNDTIYYGKKKPFFYADFDTAFHQNEIRIVTLKDKLNVPANGFVFYCTVSGAIVDSITYSNSCRYAQVTVSGGISNFIMQSLPLIDFTQYSLIIMPKDKLNYANANQFFKVRLINNQTNYSFQRLFAECNTILPGLSPSVDYFISLKPLINNKTIIQQIIKRHLCVGSHNSIPYRNDTISIETTNSFLIK